MLEKFLITIIVFSVLIIGINNTQLAFAGACNPGDDDSDGDGVFCDPSDEGQRDPDDQNPCIPNLDSPACMDSQVGGKIIPIDSISLLVAGVQANYSILTALAVVGVGAGFAALRLKQK